VGSIAKQQLGYAELKSKNWGGAVELLEESVKRDPKQVQSWIWLGQAHQNAGNRARAIECYRKVLELKPGEPNATKGLKSLGL
jgi:Tfp pilus assembly protein PilF